MSARKRTPAPARSRAAPEPVSTPAQATEIPWKRAHPHLTEAFLSVEQGVMKRAYPQFRLVWRDGHLLYAGHLRTHYGQEYHVELHLPPQYPEAEPHTFVISPPLPPNTPHRYVDGRICAHATPFVAWKTHAATMVSVVAGWLHRLDRWRVEGLSWELPLVPEGQPLIVHPDGRLETPHAHKR